MYGLAFQIHSSDMLTPVTHPALVAEGSDFVLTLDPQQVGATTDAKNLGKHSTSDLVNAIDLLPNQERLVLTLRYYEELTIKEISAVLEIESSEVRRLHAAAVKRLAS